MKKCWHCCSLRILKTMKQIDKHNLILNFWTRPPIISNPDVWLNTAAFPRSEGRKFKISIINSSHFAFIQRGVRLPRVCLPIKSKTLQVPKSTAGEKNSIRCQCCHLEHLVLPLAYIYLDWMFQMFCYMVVALSWQGRDRTGVGQAKCLKQVESQKNHIVPNTIY